MSVRKLCINHSAFRFCGYASTAIRLISDLANARPDIILMEGVLLKRSGLTELAQMHCALPAARTLVIGDSLDVTAILAALRLGMRGILPTMRLACDLEHALRAVAGGDLWLSRQQLACLLMVASAEPEDDLAELTPRENAVMRGVLLGQSNKQIARALNIAEHTVKIHLHHVFAKLHVHRRIELLVHFRREACFPHDLISSHSFSVEV